MRANLFVPVVRCGDHLTVGRIVSAATDAGLVPDGVSGRSARARASVALKHGVRRESKGAIIHRIPGTPIGTFGVATPALDGGKFASYTGRAVVKISKNGDISVELDDDAPPGLRESIMTALSGASDIATTQDVWKVFDSSAKSLGVSIVPVSQSGGCWIIPHTGHHSDMFISRCRDFVHAIGGDIATHEVIVEPGDCIAECLKEYVNDMVSRFAEDCNAVKPGQQRRVTDRLSAKAVMIARDIEAMAAYIGEAKDTLLATVIGYAGIARRRRCEAIQDVEDAVEDINVDVDASVENEPDALFVDDDQPASEDDIGTESDDDADNTVPSFADTAEYAAYRYDMWHDGDMLDTATNDALVVDDAQPASEDDGISAAWNMESEDSVRSDDVVSPIFGGEDA